MWSKQAIYVINTIPYILHGLYQRDYATEKYILQHICDIFILYYHLAFLKDKNTSKELLMKQNFIIALTKIDYQLHNKLKMIKKLKFSTITSDKIALTAKVVPQDEAGS